MNPLQQELRWFSGFTTRIFHQHIIYILSIADKYDGVCYGGCVRDFLSMLEPKRAHLDASTSVRNIDIWFKSKEGRQLFLTDASTSKSPYSLGDRFSNDSYTNDTGLDTITYSHMYDKQHNYFIDVNLVVCEFFPGFDALPNLLIYDFKNEKVTLPVEYRGIYSLDSILNDIEHKKMRLTHTSDCILEAQEGVCSYYKHTIDRSVFSKRIEEFRRRGWKVSTIASYVSKCNKRREHIENSENISTAQTLSQSTQTLIEAMQVIDRFMQTSSDVTQALMDSSQISANVTQTLIGAAQTLVTVLPTLTSTVTITDNLGNLVGRMVIPRGEVTLSDFGDYKVSITIN